MITRILFIGDLHGSNKWQELQLEKYNKVIFLGDYCDSYVRSNVEILDNLKKLIEFRKKIGPKVTLLWGNHEQHYLFGYPQYGCSGYRAEMYPDLHQLLHESRTWFQLAWQQNDLLATHAGVTTHWYNTVFQEEFAEKCPEESKKDLSIADKLNLAFERRLASIFMVGKLRGGYSRTGGPLWADSIEFGKFDLLPNIHQVVGHNPVDSITTRKWTNTESITFCDTRNENGILKTFELQL